LKVGPIPDDSRDQAGWPSPGGPLETREPELCGRLKIYLGAVPGVGKTFEMLMGGHSKIADGVDVVIGVAETTGARKPRHCLLVSKTAHERFLSGPVGKGEGSRCHPGAEAQPRLDR
jgi:hypothetical protein